MLEDEDNFGGGDDYLFLTLNPAFAVHKVALAQCTSIDSVDFFTFS